MGVKVKHWKGAYWVFVHHRGQRKAKRVSEGNANKKAAQLAAVQIAAKLASGDNSVFEDTRARALTLQEYAEGWLKTHASQACKFSTVRIYEVNLRRHVFPVLGTRPVGAVNRGDCRGLILACREKGLSRKSIETSGAP